MDNHLLAIYEKKIAGLIRNLERNNMKGVLLQNKEELESYLDTNMKDGAKVAVGGSQTLFELNLIEYIRNRDVEFFDRYAADITPEGRKEVFRKSFGADYYLASTNAITTDGFLYSVDAVGNRVAALLYGPDKVFVIVGINKIVNSVDEAVNRVREIAAPANSRRLNRNTPCTETGSCMDCKVATRLCNEFILIKRQEVKDRIEVLIVMDQLGY